MTFVRWIGLVAGLLIALGSVPSAAQSTAEAFFHEAAGHYIADDLTAARQAVGRGLEIAPEDPRLLALQKKLDEEASSGGGSTGQQGDTGESESQQSGGSGGQEQASNRSQQQGAQPNGAGGADSQSSQQGPDQPSSTQAGSETPQSSSGQTADGVRQGTGSAALSPEQAARLLQALEAQEKTLLREIQAQSKTTQSVEKDW